MDKKIIGTCMDYTYDGKGIVKKDKLVRDYLGLALIPQAGVAIGLAALGARTLGGAVGDALQTIILSSSVLYEMVGPACAKLSLYLSKSYSTKLEDITEVVEVKPDGKEKTAAEILIERIQEIEKANKYASKEISKEEQAFNEASEESLEFMYNDFRYRNLRRKM